MAKALETWPMHVIEEALADDADGILPQAVRSAELRVRLPVTFTPFLGQS